MLAEAVGMEPDESQRFTLRAALGERANHTWAAFEVADLEPRQNGKGDTIQIRELAGLVLFGEKLQIHTAHELSTALEAQLRMVEILEGDDELAKLIKSIRYSNGKESIELTNGARLKYKARTGGGGRGFAGASLVVYDEAYALTVDQLAASLPTLSTGKNPQVWYASSAGLSTSTALHMLRRRAIEGNAGRFAYCEHTAERPYIDPTTGAMKSHPIDESDEANVALANPAYGHRISKDYVDAERRAFSAEPGKFARERLGVFDPLPEDVKARPVKLPQAQWTGRHGEGGTVVTERVAVVPGAMTIAFAVEKNGTGASISIAGGHIARPYVETIEHRDGVEWLPARLVALVKKWKPLAVGCNGGGPAGAQVGPILAAFDEDDDVPDDTEITQMGVQQYKHACGGFFTAVRDGRAQRPEDGPLTLAGQDAAERPLGDAFAFDKRTETVSITPLESAVVAAALLPTAAEPELVPLMAFT